MSATRGARRRGLTIGLTVMVDLLFNLCLLLIVDDFQEERHLVEALNEARAELIQLQEEIEQAGLEEPPGEGELSEPPAGELVVDPEQRVALNGQDLGHLTDGEGGVVERLLQLVADLPPGRLRLRLDRRLPVGVYAAIWPAVAGRDVSLAVE